MSARPASPPPWKVALPAHPQCGEVLWRAVQLPSFPPAALPLRARDPSGDPVGHGGERCWGLHSGACESVRRLYSHCPNTASEEDKAASLSFSQQHSPLYGGKGQALCEVAIPPQRPGPGLFTDRHHQATGRWYQEKQGWGTLQAHPRPSGVGGRRGWTLGLPHTNHEICLTSLSLGPTAVDLMQAPHKLHSQN